MLLDDEVLLSGAGLFHLPIPTWVASGKTYLMVFCSELLN